MGPKRQGFQGPGVPGKQPVFHSELGFLPHIGPKPQGGLVLRKLPLQPGIPQTTPSLFQMCSRLQRGWRGGPRWRGGWYHFWGPGAVLQGILHKLRPRCFSGSEGALETTCPVPTFYTQGNRGRKWGVSSIPEPNKGYGGQAVTQ